MVRFLLFLLVLVLVVAAPASAGVGSLSQPAGTAACVSETGSGGQCADGAGLAVPEAVAVSPDGRNVYTAGYTQSTIAIFARDQATGALTETGCLAASSVAGCATVSEGAVLPNSLAVSADGKTLYAGSSVAGTVSAFPRDPTTGALGPAYCFGYSVFVGCSHDGGRALRTTTAVAASPDGQSVYSTSVTDRGVAELAHDDATGHVTQSASTDGCISYDGTSYWAGKPPANCTSMFNYSAFQTPRGIAIAPDGKSVLVADSASGLMDFDRSSAGVLSTRVCYGSVAACPNGHGVKAAWDVAVTSDGKGVYVASANPGGVAVFDRNPATGGLVPATFTNGSPPQSSNGCINQDGSEGCTQGRAVAGALAVVVSPDGQNVYLDGEASGAIGAFARDAGTNQLRQLDGSDGCTSYNGSGGLCSQGKLMESIKDMAISPDGKNIYAVSQNNQAVLVFDRDTGAGSTPAPSPTPAPTPAPTPDPTGESPTTPTGGSGGGGSGGGGGGRASELSALRVAPRAFALTGRLVNGRCVPVNRANRKQRSCTRTIALRVSYTLTLPATVTFTIEQSASGRLVNGRCARVTRANRRQRRCTRKIALPGTLTRASAAGADSLTFTGRTDGHTLAPSHYTLVAIPAAGGNTGARQSVPFRVTR